MKLYVPRKLHFPTKLHFYMNQILYWYEPPAAHNTAFVLHTLLAHGLPLLAYRLPMPA
jgi:hypothetical protein